MIESSKKHGELTVSKTGDVTFLFQGNDSVNGLSITVNSNSILINVHGITEEYSREELPDNSPVIIFYESLKSAANSTPELKGEQIMITGKNSYGTYDLLLDSSGFITQIEIDSGSSKINFSNHHIDNQ